VELPWFRVLRSDGRIAFPPQSKPYREQRARLLVEGVRVERGRVDLARYGWDRNLDFALWAPRYGWDRNLDFALWAPPDEAAAPGRPGGRKASRKIAGAKPASGKAQRAPAEAKPAEAKPKPVAIVAKSAARAAAARAASAASPGIRASATRRGTSRAPR